MAEIILPTAEKPLVTVEARGESAVTDLPRDTVMDLYRAHGAILFRGFAADLDAFARFARNLCPTAVKNESPGRVTIDASATIQSVNLGGDAFPLHPELSREPFKPDAAFFICMEPPARGGETTVCDGVALAAALPKEVRDGLTGRRLVYAMPTWPGLLQFWLGTSEPDDAALASPPPSCPYTFRRMADGAIARLFSRPALHRPMFSDAPAFGNFLLFARFHNGRGDFPLLDDYTPVPEHWLQAIHACGERLSYPLSWQRGDLVLLDNTRFMHGRRAIEDPAQRHIITYFGYLADARPDPEEPSPAIWRQQDFLPPANPAFAR
ncbi:MAG: TauD/TfdA family dioxygenase [Novosphingobium sp.]